MYIISLFPHLHTPFPPFSPSLISLVVSVDVKHHVYLLTDLLTKDNASVINYLLVLSTLRPKLNCNYVEIMNNYVNIIVS